MQDNWGDRHSDADAETQTETDTETDAAPAPVSAGVPSALPDLKPWNQAGWIFLDGDCVAIARRGDELEDPDRKARVLAD